MALNSFDPRRTGWGIEDIIEECERHDWNPYNQVFYTTYSDIYHTNPDCPHIQNSERLHYASSIGSLDGIPLAMGGHRFANELDECSWCVSNNGGNNES